MQKKEIILISAAILVAAATGFATQFGLNSVLLFVLAAVALVLVAMIVGKATEQLGSRMGPAATGVLQSALGNLPELFVCIFALRAGLDTVVKAALVGSILGNSVLVFGTAILLGGLKNGRQYFHSEPPKMNAVLMILAVAAMAVPTLTYYLHTPAESHLNKLDMVVAIVLLVVFSAYLTFSIKGDKSFRPDDQEVENHDSWSLPLTLGILAASGVGAAFVSDWFVQALTPAMDALGINEVFSGLIIVAIAGNAIENIVGIQLALKNKSDYAVSVIMNSSLQIALVVYPLLILLSFFLGGAVLSFVLSPLLLAALALSVCVSAFIVFDGESIWLEGVALIGLYIIIATAFWWG
ncbi:calcium/proton exchanger [Chryseobacterium sp. SNU WT5]|uniref:calcium/proton exchanger n=1 Tax=Chryseobacterium sp. SNU WT5 TaxID=2594269 RepID=UPI00117F64CA|nr:calcium/proton exchanger [Chryseobacterium sp. SNU WT5]QDP84010.1 calcium/proton exchanger [Chryseobacterium sp. SNU WT5]